MSSRPGASSPDLFWPGVALASVFLIALAWLSTGTLTPYASTCSVCLERPPCSYLRNIDDTNFEAVFWMLDGKPRELWNGSVVLRRTLYPLLAYPWMKVFGFFAGGLLTNALVHLAVLLVLAVFVRRRLGTAPALALAGLFATYPGIHYWIGLPYSYAAIVPASVAATLALWKMEETTAAAPLVALALLVGVLFLAYDLMPFFAPAALAVAWRSTRRAPVVVGVAAALALPSLLNLLALARVFHAPLSNPNTATYGVVLRAWTHWPDLSRWMGVLLDAPSLLIDNFFASNMYVLPGLFIVAMAAGRPPGPRLAFFEKAILLSVLVVWAFANLAPPYEARWQLRGAWVARLYQPSIGVLLTAMGRAFAAARGERSGPIVNAGAGAAMLLGAGIVLGPWWSPTLTSNMYYRFYQHGQAGSMMDNLAKHGRRPLGFCKPPN
jgi:hypothetical protein